MSESECPSLLELADAAVAAVHRYCQHDAHTCPCTCGCSETVQYSCFTPLCDDCHVNWIRGHDDCGL